jgi:hypothetical protein
MVACKSAKTNGVKITKVNGVYDYGSPKVEQVLLDHNTFKIMEVSRDPTYGYTEGNPIMVGKDGGNGPMNERRFLNALTGPNGETIKYSRLGSCCHFKTKNGLLNDAGLLDKYSITYKGLEKEIILYINMYDSDVLKVPVGFKKKMY